MAIRGSATFDKKSVRRTLKSLKRTERFLRKEGPSKLVRTLTWYALQRVKDHSPVRTGQFRDGWRATIVRGSGGVQGRVRHKWENSQKGKIRLRAIEYGAKPHVIEAVRKRVLSFRFKSGDKGLMPRVNHPGMKGFFMRTQTMREVRRYTKQVKKAFARSVKAERKAGATT